MPDTKTETLTETPANAFFSEVGSEDLKPALWMLGVRQEPSNAPFRLRITENVAESIVGKGEKYGVLHLTEGEAMDLARTLIEQVRKRASGGIEFKHRLRTAAFWLDVVEGRDPKTRAEVDEDTPMRELRKAIMGEAADA